MMKTTTPTPSKKRTQSGVALLFVTVMTAIIAALAADFAYSTQVDLEEATNAKDQLRAEYLAKSAVEFGKLLISAQEQISQQIQSLPKIDGLNLDTISVTDYADLIINLLLSGEKTSLPPEDSLSLRIHYEDGKYPLHCSGGLNPDKVQQQLLYSLINPLFRAPKYTPYFDKIGRDGILINRENLAKWLIDWIDGDEQSFEPERSGTTPEEKYVLSNDKYDLHNFYLDSIDELREVRGIERHAIFQTLERTLTIYHTKDCKVSIASLDASSWVLLTGILQAVSSDKTTSFDPNTESLAKQLAPLLKTLWPMLRDQPLSKVLQALDPGASQDSFKPPNGKSSFCVSPKEAACASFQTEGESETPATGTTAGSTAPKRQVGRPVDQAVNNLSELICSPFIAKLTGWVPPTDLLSLGANNKKTTTSPSVPLRPIPLCQNALLRLMKTPSSNAGNRRFFTLEATGQVQRKKGVSVANIKAIWDTGTIVANPICSLPKCKRGTWVYYRIH